MATHTFDATTALRRLQRRVDDEFDPETARLAFERARSFEHLADADRMDHEERALWRRRASRARQRFEAETGVEYGAFLDRSVGRS